jgi:hypothetical protein
MWASNDDGKDPGTVSEMADQVCQAKSPTPTVLSGADNRELRCREWDTADEEPDACGGGGIVSDDEPPAVHLFPYAVKI